MEEQRLLPQAGVAVSIVEESPSQECYMEKKVSPAGYCDDRERYCYRWHLVIKENSRQIMGNKCWRTFLDSIRMRTKGVASYFDPLSEHTEAFCVFNTPRFVCAFACHAARGN